MNRSTRRETIPGPAGTLELAIDLPAQAPRGLAVVAHPHPLQGGTLDNKVAQTLARAWVQLGFAAVRPNFRGVGASQGAYTEGLGETDDLRAAMVHAQRELGLADDAPLAISGFSFGGFVAARLCAQLREQGREVHHLCLVAPAVASFAVPAMRDEAGNTLARRMLVVHGEADDVVPLGATMDWALPQAQPVLVVPGAGHFFHGMLTPLKQWVCAWHATLPEA